ncbi:hypothetical protein [Chryseobacterium sp. KCF3-3]|uniref:hypothetical protein n=1 Tax=Chryseobacterium sp. KCF3-3 TaxID=3231511 RepID=UPI0038B376FE
MKKTDVIKSIIETGSEISGGIGSALLSAVIPGTTGIIVGGAAAPILTKIFTDIGTEIQNRFLSSREVMRTGAAYTFAIDRIRQNENEGHTLRDDDFFEPIDNNRPASEELLEAIILSAQRESEELKLKFLGNLYANICFHPEINRAHANQIIKNSNTLSFQQFCILQLFYEKLQDTRALKVPKLRADGNWEIKVIDIISETRELQQKGLISIDSRMNESDLSSPIPLAKVNITSVGKTFCELLSLNQIDNGILSKLNDVTEIKY